MTQHTALSKVMELIAEMDKAVKAINIRPFGEDDESDEDDTAVSAAMRAEHLAMEASLAYIREHGPSLLADARDAARYRWLRENHRSGPPEMGRLEWYLPRNRGGFLGLDQAIDTAIDQAERDHSEDSRHRVTDAALLDWLELHADCIELDAGHDYRRIGTARADIDDAIAGGEGGS